MQISMHDMRAGGNRGAVELSGASSRQSIGSDGSGDITQVRADLRAYDSARSAHSQEFLQKRLNPDFFSRDNIEQEIGNLDYTPCVNRALRELLAPWGVPVTFLYCMQASPWISWGPFAQTAFFETCRYASSLRATTRMPRSCERRYRAWHQIWTALTI